MFEHLDDPTPPQPGDSTRAAVATRARQLVVHRRITALSTAVAVLALAVGVPAVVFASHDGGHKRVQAAAGPRKAAGEPGGVITPAPEQSPDTTAGGKIVATGPAGAARTTTTRPGARIGSPSIIEEPKVPLRLADAIVFQGGASSYAGGPASEPGIYVMNADGSGERRLTTSADVFPAWSPDRSQITFARSGELWVMKPDGSAQSRLTSGANDGYPASSPDGTKIAFSSTDRSGGGIFVMNPDGTAITKVVADAMDPSWSPDGKKLAFMRDDNENAEVFVVNVNGTGEINLTNNAAWDAAPAWSPDGKKIAFESGRDSPKDDIDIYVMNADGTNPVQLAHDPAFDHAPAWSPDGKKLAFDSFRQPCGLPDNGCLEHLWTMNADGSEPKLLTQWPIEQGGPDW
jgi:TolB protein